MRKRPQAIGAFSNVLVRLSGVPARATGLCGSKKRQNNPDLLAGGVTPPAFSASYVWLMKKGELKNRLRRRTADKLYDLARSTGRMPAHLSAVETPNPALDDARRNGRMQAKRRSGRPR